MSGGLEITPELLAGFLDEAPEYLEMLDEGLMEFESKAGAGFLALETPEDQERMNTMFRAAHSLKGLAAAFGFVKIKELTHRMETLFDEVRMGKRQLTADSFETLFHVFDKLKDLVKELAGDHDGSVDIADALVELDQILATDGGMAGDGDGGAAGAESEEQTKSSQADAEADTTSDTSEQPVLFDDPELMSLFLETTIESLDELNQGLLGLEQNPDDDALLNSVFRCAHNIKGATGAAGLVGMNRLTHDMETVFDLLRSRRLELNDEVMSAVFRAVDLLRGAVDAIRDSGDANISVENVQANFAQWISPSSDKPDAAQPAPDGPDAADHVDGAAGGTDETEQIEGPFDGKLRVTVTFPDGSEDAPIQAYLIYNKLCDIGTEVGSQPDVDSMAGDTPVTKVVYELETDAASDEIQKLISAYNVAGVVVSGTEDTAPPATTRSNEPPVEAAAASASGSERESAEAPSPGTTKPASTEAALASGKQATPPNVEPARSGTNGKSAGSATPAAKRDHAHAKTGETLRVDQERLDQLMNLGGELVINRARFRQVHGQFRDVFDGRNFGGLVDDMGEHIAQLDEHLARIRSGGVHGRDIDRLSNHLMHLRESFGPVRTIVRQVHNLRTSMFDFDEAIHALTRVSEGIQTGIMSTRMVPIGPMFNRFRRVVRDIAKSNGKQINLILRGENTELDKRMIDELGDPLTHMVRNSGDHGIETPDVREAAGKNPVGTLILEACHRGNSICIEATDDGAGINVDRVKEKVLERELATPAQVEAMSDRDLIQYILMPGFSTAKKVTDVSGRGMGMDIVVNKIEKLSGTIEIDSTPGQGTRIVIKLPLTLAILTSLVARINKGIYAIPLETVAEIIAIPRSRIQSIQKREVVRVRDRVVPVAWFEEVFATNLPGLQTAARDADELTLVIIGVENDQIGLVVDELLGQEDVVIKSIAENYVNVRGIAGASIRGDGTVSLILDVGAMMEMAASGAVSAVSRRVPAGA